MNLLKTKIILFVIFLLSIMFFSNDFGLIDIEKTAIVTAIAIDYNEEENAKEKYLITAQIAVPEVSNTTAENPKAIIEGKGNTIAEAINSIGNISGWYPKLAFCNLIICGNKTADENLLKEIDYFARTLNVQDSATVILAEKTASELLQTASPFDNISSFALQKILLKDPGFDNDVAVMDIRNFVKGCFSKSKSTYMPLVKIIEQKTLKNSGNNSDENQSNGQGEDEALGENSSSEQTSSSGNENKGDVLFDATTTALFKDGKLVYTLDKDLTTTFNLLMKNTTSTTLPVTIIEGDKKQNYLLSFLEVKPNVKLTASEVDLTLKVDLNIYAKIIDSDVTHSDATYTKNVPIPSSIIKKTENMLSERIQNLVGALKTSKCDFFNVYEKLYRFNYKHFFRYKDNYFEKLKLETSVCVTGQK